jgi:hypothetical protein
VLSRLCAVARRTSIDESNLNAPSRSSITRFNFDSFRRQLEQRTARSSRELRSLPRLRGTLLKHHRQGKIGLPES